MLLAAGDAISARVGQDELNPGFIFRTVFDPHVVAEVAEAVSSADTKNE
jgi:malate dehydrogenase (oxaloacetate-decarboxylating)